MVSKQIISIVIFFTETLLLVQAGMHGADWKSSHDFRGLGVAASASPFANHRRDPFRTNNDHVDLERRIRTKKFSTSLIRPQHSKSTGGGITSRGRLALRASELTIQTENEKPTEEETKEVEDDDKIPKLDWAVALTYFCNALAVNLPIILMPVIAAEHGQRLQDPTFVASAFVASAASIATLGGGFGKFINGFVCKSMGGKTSASLYLGVMTFLHVALAVNTNANMVGWILAGLEFCASIQWTAGLTLLANHYAKTNPIAFTRGITRLSLSSTAGVLTAKLGGTVLLQSLPSWRAVQGVAASFSLLGAFLMQWLASEYPQNKDGETVVAEAKSKFSLQEIGTCLRAVLGNRFFWMVGFAHSTAFLARSSDRILGSFFLDATSLPRQLCGGLTASVTLGFAHGLRNSRRFNELREQRKGSVAQVNMLKNLYLRSFVGCVALAALANSSVAAIFPSGKALAAVIFGLTAYLSSNLSFQFYHIPAMAANSFGENRAVGLSFMDGLGFFLSAPAWAATGMLVKAMGAHGWTAAWLMLASLFGIGSILMLKQLPAMIEDEATNN